MSGVTLPLLTLLLLTTHRAPGDIENSSYTVPLDSAAIKYFDTPTTDPVAILKKHIDAGKVKLRWDKQFGYLPDLLRQLKISKESQVLVFSKTSFQNDNITPTTPRAIYFNDDSYVGVVQNSDVVELTSMDPKQGAIFYTFTQYGERKAPTIIRENAKCTTCHSTSRTVGVPGPLIRSVYVRPDGLPILRAGAFRTTHRSPFKQRWGGWYVTGKHPRQSHMGNAFAKEVADNTAEIDQTKNGQLLKLDKFFDTSKYLTPHSDIVALLVLEHQAHGQNLITRAGWETRLARHDQSVMDKMLKRDPGKLSSITRRRIQSAGDALIRYLLFIDEAYVRGPITGTSRFAGVYPTLNTVDAERRKLRQLKLRKRLYDLPLSPLIHSRQFDAMPKPMLDYVYKRLYDILTGKDQSEDFQLISSTHQHAVLAILRKTKKNLPGYYFK